MNEWMDGILFGPFFVKVPTTRASFRFGISKEPLTSFGFQNDPFFLKKTLFCLLLVCFCLGYIYMCVCVCERCIRDGEEGGVVEGRRKNQPTRTTNYAMDYYFLYLL
jgi:hypothetical protein